MKRNELFKKLMNVQSQVTSLMNVVLQESSVVTDGMKAAGEIASKAVFGQDVETVYSEAKYLKKEITKAVNEISASDNEIPELQTIASKLQEGDKQSVFNKVLEMNKRLGGDINHGEFLTTCKYMGVASIALGCIFGYILFPTIKNGLIAAFNNGSPDLERLNGLLKSVASSSIVLGLIVFGGILLYHAFRSDNLNAANNPLLASILQALNNVSRAIRNKFRSPIVPVGNKSWAW